MKHITYVILACYADKGMKSLGSKGLMVFQNKKLLEQMTLQKAAQKAQNKRDRQEKQQEIFDRQSQLLAKNEAVARLQLAIRSQSSRKDLGYDLQANSKNNNSIIPFIEKLYESDNNEN